MFCNKNQYICVIFKSNGQYFINIIKKDQQEQRNRLRKVTI